ncbi:MAG: permease, partial [Sneathiella sp.]
VFAVTMLIQFVSYLMEAIADYLEEPGHKEHEVSIAAG